MFSVLGRRELRRGIFAAALAFCAAALLLPEPESLAVVLPPRKLPIYGVKTEEKVLALGFNCAWGDEDVPVLLETLARYEAPATFFVVGDWARKYPQSCRMLFDAGHEVQSHSDTHPDMTAMSREGILQELHRSRQTISQITGVTPTLFRPPSGAYNDLLIETAGADGWQCIQWNVDSLDWKNPAPNDLCNRVLERVKPGSILLLHVGAKPTPEALPLLLEALRNQGYSFRRVSDLIYRDNYSIDFQGLQHPLKNG